VGPEPVPGEVRHGLRGRAGRPDTPLLLQLNLTVCSHCLLTLSAHIVFSHCTDVPVHTRRRAASSSLAYG